ncbi:hypothetical protein J3A78_002131 [Streptomyces sp. PvR006]|uniref:DUF6907 domain-containing protein n=1 Tax=Streptomyces sp. PvR006 TaxID=2817860 RepID=UPI001AE640BE|nr:hypothetical protein [Streptomyces sp. PvR006]MBP2581653.1 hypothetical protein [Streptomyces sp. PvR006]
MSITVQRAAHRLLASLPSALRIGRQTAARDRHSVPVTAPRSWTFADRETGQEMTFTCMPGCVDRHDDVAAGQAVAEDVWCHRATDDVTLPINDSGNPEELSVLRVTLNVDPFDRRLAQRLPHIDLEVMSDAWIEGLDADGFATVINTLQGRLDEMRAMHAELISVRAAYQKQAQR